MTSVIMMMIMVMMMMMMIIIIIIIIIIITPQTRVLLEQTPLLQLVKISFTFDETQTFITVLTTAGKMSLS